MSENISVGEVDRSTRLRLDALCSTLAEDDIPVFEKAVKTFSDLDTFFSEVTLLTWGAFFPVLSPVHKEIVARVFLIISNLVPLPERMPTCRKCGKDTELELNKKMPFGFRYRCINNYKMSRKEARKRQKRSRFICVGVVQATYNTWFQNAKSIHMGLGLLFCWTNRLGVTMASEAVGCGNPTAIQHYSIMREVAELILSNEVRNLANDYSWTLLMSFLTTVSMGNVGNPLTDI